MAREPVQVVVHGMTFVAKDPGPGFVRQPTWLSPDCKAGKCTPCSGDAWNETTDEPSPCGHNCHQGQDS